ncbi:MAG: TIM-barrel domain-containing protein [Ginsengibacter sp.]
MMNRRFYIALTFLFSVTNINAQEKNSFSSTLGKWKFTLYSGNITKSTFEPINYLHNEQVSNAVIAKPADFTTPYKNFAINISTGNINYYHGHDTLLMLNYFDSTGFKGFRFRLNDNEKIFGTGERSLLLNRRGYKLDLYNTPHYGYGIDADNLNYTVPFILSSGGYGIFFDNPSKSYLDIGKTNGAVLEYGASSGELSFYIIPGKNVDEIITKYQSLVGTQPIPARWVFGNLMSRFGYRSQEQLFSTVHKMKQESVPLDAVILDLFWFGDSIKGTLGNLAWVNKNAWPQPGAMIKNLKKQGINTILITEPYILNTTTNYGPSKKFQAVDSSGNPFVLTNFYFGNGGLLDLFRKDAQDWFWGKYKTQIAMGVAGWWGDLGEPETHPVTMNHNLKDLGFKRLFKADEVHNIYGHYWDKMLFDKYAKEYPDVRLFNLNRSGYAGSPRYSIFPWSGDVGRNWDGLKAQLPIMIGMSMSGVPYIHADAGGYAGGDDDKELYTRWLQFATFTPVFRPHGTALGNADTNAKDIPSEACFYPEPYKSIVRRYINLRYTFLPYNYTLAYEEAKFGRPLVRPLFYYNNTDSNLFKAQDEYFWGDNILVAPVLEKSATERKVYLPESNWYNFFTDEKMEGKKWITEKTDINNIPVFVKEGSFIPMFTNVSPIKNTNDYTGKSVTIKYYPSSYKSNYTLFDDDGVTNNTLSKGKFELISFEGKTIADKIDITISSPKKQSGHSKKIQLIFPGDKKILSVKINGKYFKRDDAENPEKNFIEFQFSGILLKMEIEFKK